jgi:hypothetical protein
MVPHEFKTKMVSIDAYSQTRGEIEASMLRQVGQLNRLAGILTSSAVNTYVLSIALYVQHLS